VQQGVDPRCTLVLEHDSVSAGFMGNLRSRTTLYCKILARGAQILAEPFVNTLGITFPFKFIENTRQDTSGVYTSTFPLMLQHDTAFGNWISAVVDNSLTAL
jgi:hypothetical protein